MAKMTKVAEKGAAAVGAAAGSVGEMVDGATKPVGKKEEKPGEKKNENPTEKPELTPNQKNAELAVRADKNLLERIETYTKIPENAQ
jgi:hypothetical protein